MSKESPVSVGNDAYVDLDRQVSKTRCFFSFNHNTSVASHFAVLGSLSFFFNCEAVLCEIQMSGKLYFNISSPFV